MARKERSLVLLVSRQLILEVIAGDTLGMILPQKFEASHNLQAMLTVSLHNSQCGDMLLVLHSFSNCYFSRGSCLPNN